MTMSFTSQRGCQRHRVGVSNFRRKSAELRPNGYTSTDRGLARPSGVKLSVTWIAILGTLEGLHDSV